VRCRLVLVRHGAKGCHHYCLDGRPSRSGHSRKQARAQREPWLLAVCPSLAELHAKAIVALYAQRMQIEESFRDLKNERFGLGLAASRSKQPDRLRVLLLIGALATFVLRLIGEVAKERQLHRQCQSNTRQSRAVLSVITIARQFIRKTLSVWAKDEFAAVFQRLKNDRVEII
jgi:transposase